MTGVAITSAEATFEGYASLFHVTDLARDSVERGAFTQSLARMGPDGVKLLWQHDPNQPVGIWTQFREDERGLYCKGRLNLGVARGRELLALLREGAVDGLSIGYRTVRARTDPGTRIRRLFSVDLWEVSLVTFPLLPQARVSVVEGQPVGRASLAATIRSAATSMQPRSH